MDQPLQLRYPKKSHRKTIIIPQPSIFLAEFFGIMIGDGGINNLWQANITLNSEKDKEYAIYVIELCYKLFRVLPAVRKRRNAKAIVISIASVTLVNFLVSMGLPRGNKLKSGLKVPIWIMSNKKYRISCVRGLIDTDGCLYIHTHNVGGRIYKNIGLCFSSGSPLLLKQVASIFDEFGILPHIDNDGKNIYIYKQADIDRYLKVFGTSNSRICTVYEKWRDARVVEWTTLER